MEPFGDPKNTAGQADILTKDDGTFVAIHHLMKRRVDCFGHGPRLGRPFREVVVAGVPQFTVAKPGFGLSVSTLHGIELLGHMLGDAGESLPYCIVSVRERFRLDGRYGGVNRVGDLHCHLFAGLLVPLASVLEETTKPFDRIFAFPIFHFLGWAIEGVVVSGGVRPVAIGQSLDKSGPFPFPGSFCGEGGGEIDGYRVHPVDPQALKAVCVRFLGDGLRCRLLLVRNGYGVEVVCADEHRRRLPHPCKIHSRVEVGRRGGAVAKIDCGHGAFSPHLGHIRVSDRMGDLAGDWHRDDSGPIFLHVPTDVGQTLPVCEKDLHRESPRYLNAVFSIGRKYEVIRLQGERRANLHCFLTFQHRIGADTTLSLECEHAAIEFSGENHVSVHHLIKLGFETGVSSDQIPMLIDDPQCFEGTHMPSLPQLAVPRFGSANFVLCPNTATTFQPCNLMRWVVP